ncbi:hypothetical protein [Reichenbachiella sp.]|uniref:hypothetical protein n=1 Tax=Reichenbachiella sp. TaxID=2184521 RepID=UPI003BB1AE41
MNTYNDNLHTNVVNSLRDLELKVKSTASRVNAATFSLYYAEDAKVNAIDKHEKARTKLEHKAAVKKQAVENSNISANVLKATEKEKNYVATAVLNAATCAANVQVASSAIVKLASDIGSMITILGAADLNTDIYNQCQDAYNKINDTARCAEVVSQHAMEASTLAAEVTANVVADRATSTNKSVLELLAVAENEYVKTSAVVDADNADMSLASKIAKEQEGLLEKAKIYNLSAKSVLKKSSRSLNINLYVPKKGMSSSGLTVSFDFIDLPFDQEENTKNPLYPIQDYYVILVKEKKVSMFSISNAESVLMSSTSSKPLYTKYKTPKGDDLPAFAQVELSVGKTFDSDGDPIQLGKNYAAFVLAVYEIEYKKTLNNFEDFLSAPSAAFMLTQVLNSPTFDVEKVSKHNNVNNMCVIDNKLTFEVESHNDKNIEYRCMFLPQSRIQAETALAKKDAQAELLKLELKASEYQVEIQEIEENLMKFKTANQDELKELMDKEEVHIRMAKNVRKRYTDEHVEEAQQAITRLTELREELGYLEDQLEKVQALHDQVTTQISENPASMTPEEAQNNPKVRLARLKSNIKPLGFFFNKTLAEHVPVGSFSLATTTLKKGKGKASDIVEGSVTIEPETTDNFGNLLEEGKYYVPVVLRVINDLEPNPEQYSSSISDFNSTPMFQYTPQG